MRWYAGLLLILSLSPSLQAVQEVYEFDKPAQREVFQRLSENLRCPKCQNQNIADSNALVSQDMKRKVYELIKKGYSEQQVIDYMKQRYGDFVYYQPPLNPLTLMLWMGPVLFMGLVLVVLIRRRKTQEKGFDKAMLAKAEKWLEDDK
ncbi:cytochrome c-type biogenesis protein [Lacimicrobium sp. SS2-24]|uniref:cytochrome c-type biogenesis protein n=1 Tax=Lacimicrobium sp. SS2-24 TaxID=2005569 RepID=UPI000B4C04B6|nr:cytochrome c-type biogenesis protein [Lacimicrobium sp. SS2-24]